MHHIYPAGKYILRGFCYNMEKRRASGIRLPLVGQPQQVIGAGVVVAGKLYEDFRRYAAGADFIVGVGDLAAIQVIRQLLLGEIPILPQLPDTGITHGHQPFMGIG